MCTVLLMSSQLEWACLHLRHLEIHAKCISRPDDLRGLWNRKENEVLQWYDVQFSRSVVFDSLRPHESQHTRPPCPSPTP